MKAKREGHAAMEVGDRILVNRGPSKRVYIIARVDIPHSTERVFATKSGGDFTIGVKVWKSDYIWNEKGRMWVPRGT